MPIDTFASSAFESTAFETLDSVPAIVATVQPGGFGKYPPRKSKRSGIRPNLDRVIGAIVLTELAVDPFALEIIYVSPPLLVPALQREQARPTIPERAMAVCVGRPRIAFPPLALCTEQTIEVGVELYPPRLRPMVFNALNDESALEEEMLLTLTLLADAADA